MPPLTVENLKMAIICNSMSTYRIFDMVRDQDWEGLEQFSSKELEDLIGVGFLERSGNNYAMTAKAQRFLESF